MGDIEHCTRLDWDPVKAGSQLLEQFLAIPHLEDIIGRFYSVRDFVFIPKSLIFNCVESIKATLRARSTASGLPRAFEDDFCEHVAATRVF